jgi:hypothetical protein
MPFPALGTALVNDQGRFQRFQAGCSLDNPAASARDGSGRRPITRESSGHDPSAHSEGRLALSAGTSALAMPPEGWDVDESVWHEGAQDAVDDLHDDLDALDAVGFSYGC